MTTPVPRPIDPRLSPLISLRWKVPLSRREGKRERDLLEQLDRDDEPPSSPLS